MLSNNYNYASNGIHVFVDHAICGSLDTTKMKKSAQTDANTACWLY